MPPFLSPDQKQRGLLTGVAFSVILLLACGGCGGGKRLPASHWGRAPFDHSFPAWGATNGVPADLINERLRVGDKLSVSFSCDLSPTCPSLEPRIGSDGTISLPYKVMVQAEGLTLKELEARIHDTCVPKLFTALTVCVRRVNGVMRVIDSSGAIHSVRPEKPATALWVVSRVLREPVRHETLEIIRPNGARLTMDGIRAMKKPAFDLPVFPGDTVICSKELR
jgi:hypothetical protein